MALHCSTHGRTAPDTDWRCDRHRFTKGAKRNPMLSPSGAIDPKGSQGPPCMSDGHGQTLPPSRPWFQSWGSSGKPHLSQGQICLLKEELLHTSWKVQYWGEMSETIFPPAKSSLQDFPWGERELFFGSNLRSVPGISSCFVSSTA